MSCFALLRFMRSCLSPAAADNIMSDSFGSKVMAFVIDTFQSDDSSVWALAEFTHPITLALML